MHLKLQPTTIRLLTVLVRVLEFIATGIVLFYCFSYDGHAIERIPSFLAIIVFIQLLLILMGNWLTGQKIIHRHRELERNGVQVFPFKVAITPLFFSVLFGFVMGIFFVWKLHFYVFVLYLSLLVIFRFIISNLKPFRPQYFFYLQEGAIVFMTEQEEGYLTEDITSVELTPSCLKINVYPLFIFAYSLDLTDTQRRELKLLLRKNLGGIFYNSN